VYSACGRKVFCGCVCITPMRFAVCVPVEPGPQSDGGRYVIQSCEAMNTYKDLNAKKNAARLCYLFCSVATCKKPFTRRKTLDLKNEANTKVPFSMHSLLCQLGVDSTGGKLPFYNGQ